MKLIEKVGSNSFVDHADLPFQVITGNGGNGHFVYVSVVTTLFSMLSCGEL